MNFFPKNFGIHNKNAQNHKFMEKFFQKFEHYIDYKTMMIN